MPENIGYQFNRLYAAPIETYRQVNTISQRNSIPPEIRWEGMECYVVSENQDYQLVGGVDNSNWVNAGETVSNPTTHFKGFFNATTVTPAISNLNGIEGDEYKVTNADGGVNVDFGAGDVFLETDDIIIFYQSEWRVKVRPGGNTDDYQLLAEKGEANGYTPLDSGAKVPIEFLPDSVVGQVEYQGAWNASTNTPDVGDPTLVKGHYYVTSVAGTYLGISYEVGDWIISNGVDWQKVDNTDAVVSVFGRIGAIVANSSDYSAFYVALSDYTASDVLAKLLTVDGAGSGLDADLLRGVHWGNVNTDIINISGSGVKYRSQNTVGGFIEIGVTSNDTSLGFINFTNSLEIGGEINVSGTGSFTGTVIAAPATLSTELVTKGQLDAAVRPYKVYTALLTQAGTNDPVATVMENNLGGSITWTRSVQGVYLGTLSITGFTNNKTMVFLTFGSGTGKIISGYRYSDSIVEVKTLDTSGFLADGLANTPIEIRVYP